MVWLYLPRVDGDAAPHSCYGCLTAGMSGGGWIDRAVHVIDYFSWYCGSRNEKNDPVIYDG